MMARNFTRSSSGLRSSSRLVQHAPVERQPGQLAVEVELRRRQRVGRSIADGCRGGRSQTCRAPPRSAMLVTSATSRLPPGENDLIPAAAQPAKDPRGDSI